MKITMEKALDAILNLNNEDFSRLVNTPINIPDEPNLAGDIFFYTEALNSSEIKVKFGDSEPGECFNCTYYRIHDLFSYFKNRQNQLSCEESQRISTLIESRTQPMKNLLRLFSFDHFYLSPNQNTELLNLINSYFPGDSSMNSNVMNDISVFDPDPVKQAFIDLIEQSTAPKVKSMFYIPDLPTPNKFALPDLEISYEPLNPNAYPDINIHPDLEASVIDDLFENTFSHKSNDYRALYIYYKICQLLLWDTLYTYQYNYGHMYEYIKKSYSSEESIIQDLESIAPNSPRFCKSICIIAAMMIQKYVKDFEIKILLFDDSPHISLWLKSDTMSAVFDPTIPPEPSVFGDLVNAKLGLPIYCDILFESKKNYIFGLLEDIQNSVHQNELPISHYVDILRQITPTNSSQLNTYEMLNALVEAAKLHSIDSNTFSDLFSDLIEGGLLGQNAIYARFINPQSSDPGLNDTICIKVPESDPPYFTISAGTWEIEQLPIDQLVNMLDSNNLKPLFPKYNGDYLK